jgi:hypothetical protein
MILNLFLIAFICGFIIEYSGFIAEMEDILTKLTKSTFKVHIPKPFSCALCCTFWIGLIYICTNHDFTLVNLTWVCLASASASLLANWLGFIREIINKIIEKLTKWFIL